MKTALITGASTGIGKCLTQLLAQDNYRLVLVARNADRLNSLAQALPNNEVIILPYDLADPSACQRIVDNLNKRNIEIDVLINNAGFGYGGTFAAQAPDNISKMIAVNITALSNLTRLLLPNMIARGHGHIMMVASIAAFQPGPYMSQYYATKAYVLSLAEGLSEELRGTGVSMTTVCPGPTRTEFFERANMNGERFAESGMIMMSAEQVARIAYRGMLRGKRVVITGFRNRLATWLARLTPNTLLLRIMRRLQKPENLTQ